MGALVPERRKVISKRPERKMDEMKHWVPKGEVREEVEALGEKVRDGC